MKKNQTPRPREGVWYALVQDCLFTVQHSIIDLWGPGGFYMVANEEAAARPTAVERIMNAGANFHEEVVFIGEL